MHFPRRQVIEVATDAFPLAAHIPEKVQNSGWAHDPVHNLGVRDCKTMFSTKFRVHPKANFHNSGDPCRECIKTLTSVLLFFVILIKYLGNLYDERHCISFLL